MNRDQSSKTSTLRRDFLPAAVMLIDADGDVLFVNETFSGLVGSEAPLPQGTPALKYFAGQSGMGRLLRPRGGRGAVPVGLKCLDGRVVPATLSSTMVSSGGALFAHLLVITPRQDREFQQRKCLRQADGGASDPRRRSSTGAVCRDFSQQAKRALRALPLSWRIRLPLVALAGNSIAALLAAALSLRTGVLWMCATMLLTLLGVADASAWRLDAREGDRRPGSPGCQHA